ncbi:glycosyltransferase [Aestuariivirga sp.]|uniref:glycosyltransferase n=1 Tax=Aestuariivirga sp. TaxID=2650926 RepID=UPI0037832483
MIHPIQELSGQTLRDPLSGMISYINYILTAVGTGVDTATARIWRNRLQDLQINFGEPIPEEAFAAVVDRILPDNTICRALSGKPSFDKSLDSIRVLNTRIIGLENLEAYLHEAGLPLVSPQNVSRKFLTEENLSRELRTVIEGRIEEDLKLFRWFGGSKDAPNRATYPDRPAPSTITAVPGGVPSVERRRRVLYYSVHGALEYDDLRLLHEAGFDVFSLGSFGDPVVKSNQLRKSEPYFTKPEDYAAMNEGGVVITDGRKRITQSFADRFDAVIVNHDPHFIIDNVGVLENTLTIRRTLGQTTRGQENGLKPYRTTFKTVRYSPREQREGMIPCDAAIYFGKFPDQYSDYRGGDCVLTFMSRARRDLARPKLSDYQAIIRGFNAKLYGLANEGIENWLGICPEAAQPDVYADCRMYLYTHSLIACYTLNFMEAMLTGCPIIAPSARFVSAGNPYPDWNEGMYEVQEFLQGGAGLTYDSVEEARRLIETVSDEELAATSERAKTFARARFDGNRIAREWRDFLLPLLS